MAKKQPKKQKSLAQIRHSEKWRMKGLEANAQELLENCETLRVDELQRLGAIIDYLSIILEDWDAL